MLIRRIISSSLHLKMKAGVMPIVLQSKPFHAVGELLNGQGIQDEVCASHTCAYTEWLVESTAS